MNYKIAVNCDCCGSVHIDQRILNILIYSHSLRGTYAFHCPRCYSPQMKYCTSETTKMLVEAGVSVPLLYPSLELEDEDRYNKCGPISSTEQAGLYLAFGSDEKIAKWLS